MDDVELAFSSLSSAEKPSDGYPAVADFIARDPDHEGYIFRRFNRLAARRLLHLQSEIITLEHKQEALDQEARTSNDQDLRLSTRNWEFLRGNAQIREAERKRVELAEQIDVKLEKYHQGLLLQSEIAKLERPSDRVLTAYRNDFHGTQVNKHKLGGSAKHMLDDAGDLVALRSPTHQDTLSRLLRDHWPFPVDTPSDYDGRSARYFKERHLLWAVNACSTALAAILLIGPILALYFVTDPDARLALVITFIVLFALGLSLSTTAARDSIFAASAAYSAVLVVFVSGNLGNAKTSP